MREPERSDESDITLEVYQVFTLAVLLHVVAKERRTNEVIETAAHASYQHGQTVETLD